MSKTLASENQEALLYMFKGEAGTRKSTQALSFAEKGKQYWFSWDRKMAGLRIPRGLWGIPINNIEYDNYEDWDSPRKKLESFRVNCNYPGGIIFDSITSMTDMTLRQTINRKAGVTRQSGQMAGKIIGGIAVNEIEDYNAESAALSDLISLAKDIKEYHNINVFLIAHVTVAEYRNNTNNTTHVSRTIVTAAKKVAHKVPAYCDEVYHFNIKKDMLGGNSQYTCLTQHSGDDFARTTLPLNYEIIFNDKSLYREWIKPAIDKMNTPEMQMENFKL